MATLTLGSSGQPSAKTINFDALFTASVANAKRTLIDNISTSNAWWARIKQMGGYASENGGTHIEEPLMYGLGNFHWYDGYDDYKGVIYTPLTFNNATRNFNFEWNDPNLEISSACLRVVNQLSILITHGFQYLNTCLISFIKTAHIYRHSGNLSYSLE